MAWPMIAMVGGSMLLGGMKAQQKKKAEARQMMLNAELTRYSPWTGFNINNATAGSGINPTTEAMGAGLNTYLGGMSGGAGAGGASPAAAGMAQKAASASPQMTAQGEQQLRNHANSMARQKANSAWADPNTLNQLNRYRSMG
jgi:hypothetical protein